MSAESMLATHSDLVLSRMNEFFKTYKPTYQDREWSEKRHAAIKAEIARRKQEDATLQDEQ